ncbi:hypothetical protein WR25_10804 [Diploscapter pachys]|uniref:39S ribosomal protein L30, mitochondrial n=1 Tax=Diploscapter pachys TaxID=2018661 RepID=A0A2A2JC99_9BILA|nr:hypothetical protein WR25_10804 [Diploscapter pachys]
MAKVIRTRWVYRKDNRWWRYLPRHSGKPNDLESQSNLDDFAQEFKDELVDVKPSKLWLAWVYRETGSEKSKKQLEHIFGREYKLGKMEVLINSAVMNDKLWNVKHLIELRPITFPNGEPNEGDIYNTTIHPDGRCDVMRGEKAESEEQLQLFDENIEWPKHKLGSKFNSASARLQDVFETNVYTPKNVKIVK